MKITVKRVKGGVIIKMGLAEVRNLMGTLDYSGLNTTFEERLPAEFKSSEAVAEDLFDKFEDAGIKSVT